MAYGGFNYLVRRTALHKVLRDKALNSPKNLKYGGYRRGLASMVYNSFDKKPSATRASKLAGVTRAWSETLHTRDKSATKSENMSNQQSCEELHKPIIQTFKKWKVYSYFKDKILGVDLADMWLICKFSKGFQFLLCVIDIYSVYNQTKYG